MNIRIEKVIDEIEFSALVESTYGKPYSFQQQDGCQTRGTFHLTVPAEEDDDYPDTVPEIVNGSEMCVNFAAWLARDAKQPLSTDCADSSDFSLKLWWKRNFYPPIQSVANDLHRKGLLEAGDYTIDIDW